MKPISGKLFCKVLEKKGWLLLRINGSHHIYGKTGSVVRLSVPVHKNQPLKAGLFNHLVKEAGLTEENFN
jgi:predicted RNA binding protein YcfA (HicA-like mRNA interferase family)